MFYKKIDRYLILYLIKVILIDVYVCGKPIDSEETKSITEDQLQFAREVCLNLEWSINVTVESCQENFWKSPFPPVFDPSINKHSTPVKIRCTTKESIRFQIEPSQNWQLVALVPGLDDTEDDYFINYSLIEPTEEYGEVNTAPVSNYTLWSTELVEGFPTGWQGGDHVPLYNDLLLPAHKDYNVKVEFFREIVDDKMFVNGLFTWNASGENDVCFDVVNSCDNTGIKDAKIWPNSKPQKLFTKLFLEDDCDIQIKGLYGTTKLKYQTPPCDYYADCIFGNTQPEIPQNVSIEAVEESFNTWEVRVNWASPRVPVDQYNVTLRTSVISTQVLAGDKTEAVFRGVTGVGLYNVSIYAILGHVAAHTSRRAIFPAQSGGRAREAEGAGGVSGAGSVVLGAAACGAAALVLACCCRRRGHRIVLPDFPPDDKPPIESDTDTMSTTLEPEDSWEIRSDKLLLHEVIGEGAFGVVRRATLNGTNVAVKMLKDFPSLEEIRSFRSEMELMKSVGVHPHLVSLVGCCSGRRPLIIAEYCSRGDLLTYLRCTWDVMVSKRNVKYYNNNIDTLDYRNDIFKCKMQMENSKLVVNKLYELQEICDTELTSLDLLSFCRQIAIGMEFLAANRVVHRDLAARNILVTADRTLKIADFGLSRDVYEENQYKQKGNGKMPVKWMALESLTRRIYTTQSDVWSFGVVVWEVATVGAAPYASVPAARLPRLLRAGYRMPRPANCSPQLYDIMLSCWRPHPRDRPTFAELHSRLDELLNSACAHHYLSLEIEPMDAPPSPKPHRYLKILMRGKRNWPRGEHYERPLKPLQSNHYTSAPATLTKTPPL